MKKKDFKSYLDKTLEELTKLTNEKVHDLAKIKAELSVGRHKNLRIAKKGRIEIARLKTLMQQKSILSKVEAKA